MTRIVRKPTALMSKIRFALITVCLLASCSPTNSSTKVVNSWKDPTATISSSQVSKILFIALVKDEPYRRMMEEKLVALSKGKGIASNTFIAGSPLTEKEKTALDQKLKSDGIDLVVIMRLKDVKEEPRYVPGTQTYGGYGGMSGGYWGGYNYAAPMYCTPGFYTTDKRYLVETDVYSTAQSKLLWSGITSSVNPSYTTTEEISRAVVESMKKEGFLSK